MHFWIVSHTIRDCLGTRTGDEYVFVAQAAAAVGKFDRMPVGRFVRRLLASPRRLDGRLVGRVTPGIVICA